MAKNCLKKLSTEVRYDCVLPVHGVKNIYLLNADDVKGATYSVDGSQIETIDIGTASAYIVEGFKMNIQYTEELVVGEYTSVVKPTVIFRRPSESDFVGAAYNGQIVNNKLVVLIEFQATGKYIVAGMNSPLVATALERDSNANGGSTMYTLTTEEGTQAVAIHGAASAVINKFKGI